MDAHNAAWEQRARQVMLVAYAAVLLLGVVVLIGWLVGSETLTRVVPGLAAMQPATALDFVLLATAGLLIESFRDSPSRVTARRVAIGLVGTVVAIAGISLVTEAIGADFPLAFIADMGQNGGRMSGITAVGHLVLAAALFARIASRPPVTHGLGILGLVIGLIGLSGYAYGPSDLYSVGYFQTLAVHTALGIALLGLAVTLGTGDVGLTRVVRSRTLAGRLARTLLPAVVLIPTVFGWASLWLLRTAGLGPGFVFALYGTSVAVLCGGLVYASGSRLDQAEVTRVEAEGARDDAERAVAELEEVTEALRRSNRDMREFTAAAAHDLRGPLTAILLGTQLLSANPSERARIIARDRIESAAQRGLGLIDDLLAYENVGKVVAEPVSIDLSLMAEAVLAAAHENADRPVAASVGAIPMVTADARLTEQLLSNLIGNGIKYSPDGPEVEFEVSGSVLPDGLVEIFVADRGLPIPEVERERIFEIFQRGSTGAARAEGTGVGLAICRRIVERQGGTIGVVDHDGWSKAFRFTLPATSTARATA